MSAPSVGPATLAFVGDFMLERRPDGEAIDAVRELLAGADAAIANVDTVLSGLGTPVPKWANLHAPRAAAMDLAAMGVTLVTMANNHAMDFRAAGMLDTCRAYDEAGVRHAGAGENLAAALAPVRLPVAGMDVAVFSVACTLPPESAAGPDSPGIAPLRVRYAFQVDESLMPEQPGTVPEVRTWVDEGDLARVRQAIDAVRPEVDAVVVVVHWGVPAPWRAPAHPVLQDYQQPLGRALIEAGADAVIGNHAHELHGIELYHDRPIAYCLGNFYIDTIAKYPWMGRASVVLRLVLQAEGPPQVEIVPELLDEDGVPRRDPAATAIALLHEPSGGFGVTFPPTGTAYIARRRS